MIFMIYCRIITDNGCDYILLCLQERTNNPQHIETMKTSFQNTLQWIPPYMEIQSTDWNVLDLKIDDKNCN